MTFITKGDVNSLISTQFFSLGCIVNKSTSNLLLRTHNRSTRYTQFVVLADVKSLCRNSCGSKCSDGCKSEGIKQIPIVTDCKQIEDELLDSKIDLAVHSLKDLPTKMTDGLCVNAVVKRNDPRDAFLSYSSKSFSELKPQ